MTHEMIRAASPMRDRLHCISFATGRQLLPLTPQGPMIVSESLCFGDCILTIGDLFRQDACGCRYMYTVLHILLGQFVHFIGRDFLFPLLWIRRRKPFFFFFGLFSSSFLHFANRCLSERVFSTLSVLFCFRSFAFFGPASAKQPNLDNASVPFGFSVKVGGKSCMERMTAFVQWEKANMNTYPLLSV